MKAFKRIPLLLAAALLVAQPAMACCCLDDLAAGATRPGIEVPACHEVLDGGETDFERSNPPECADCADYEAAPAGGAIKAVAPEAQPLFKLSPAGADPVSTFLRSQTVRIIGPPVFIARPSLTPVDLKQRLLF